MMKDNVRQKNQLRLKVLLNADGCIAKSLVVSLAVEQSSVMQVAKLRFEPLKRADAITGR